MIQPQTHPVCVPSSRAVLPLLAAVLMPAFATHAIAQSTAAGLGPKQCWSQFQLGGRLTDKVIVKDTPKAIVAPPTESLAPFEAQPRGAIRRVELPPGDKRIALTFDLCEQPYEVAGYDAEIVNILRESGAKATFFSGGKWMLTHPEQTQQLLADPLFEIGNHSWEHRNLRLLEGQRQRDEIAWAQMAYERQAKRLADRRCLVQDGSVFKQTPAKVRMSLFRFPFGACNPAALDTVAELGLLPIQWDVSSGDPTRSLTGEAMAAAVVRQVRAGSIVLFHANGRGWSTAAGLRIMIPKLRAMGFEFATVGELLATKGAKVRREDICYDARPGDVDRHDELARRLSAAYDRFYAKISAGAAGAPATSSPDSDPAPAQSDGLGPLGSPEPAP